MRTIIDTFMIITVLLGIMIGGTKMIDNYMQTKHDFELACKAKSGFVVVTKDGVRHCFASTEEYQINKD